MLDRFGRSMYRLRWWVIALWCLVAVVSALAAPRVATVLHGGGYTIGSSQSVDAYNALSRAYGYRALAFTVAFAGERAQLPAAAAGFRVRAERRFGRTLDIRPPVWSPDRAIMFERIYSQPQQDFGARFVGPMRALLPHGRVHGYVAGSSAIFSDMETVSDEDLHHVELVTLPIAAAVLLLIFGTLVASATPVLMALVSVTAALAIIFLLGHRIDMSIFVLNTTSMLGLGVAIDYSLLMVMRFREELDRDQSIERAVGRTVATAGRAIMVSAIVVTVGFGAMTLSGVAMLRSLGLGGSIVVLLSLVVALTLLPAVLGVLGPRIDLAPVLPRVLASLRLWRRVSLWVMQRPIAIIAIVVAIVGVLALPAFHLRVGIPGPEILPSSVESRAGNELLNRHLGLLNRSPVLVVVEREPATRLSTAVTTGFTVLDRVCGSREVVGLASVPVPDSPSQVRSCQSALVALQRASGSNAAARLAAHHDVALIAAFLRSNPSSAAAESFVTSLRSQPAIRGYRILVGGQTAGQLDFDHYLYARFPWLALLVVATIFVVLLIAFRSVILPLKAVIMNVCSILAAYGVVVFAFQDGHLSRLLGFTPVGNIDSIVPIFLFCVLFGVSTDYEIFLLTRVQEEYLGHGDNEESVAAGLEVTGRIITSAAAVMVIIFAAFSFARLVVIQEIGLGLALAVLVDATLIRALLVPATMRLLGRWNWWLPGIGFPPVGARAVDATSRSPAAQ